MASLELARLWKLHLVDAAIHDLRARAAALDPGRKVQAEIIALEKKLEEVGGEAKRLSAEAHDLELAQKSLDDKLKQFDRDLYGGKIVNPREVEAYEKEIAMLKRHREEQDARLLELWDLMPPAQKLAEAVEAKLAERRKALAVAHKAALAQRAEIEAAFKQRQAERPQVESQISPALKARYDQIRQRTHGLGMAEVRKNGACGGCGTQLPERTLQALREDKVATCESCHRILYFTEGVV